MTDKLSPVALARLRVAISSLPEPSRSVYLLCARDELDFCEIAQRLELTVPEVRAHLAEALVELTAAMAGDETPRSRH